MDAILTTINTDNLKRILCSSDIKLMKNVLTLNKSDELKVIWLDNTIEPEIKQTLKELHTHTDTFSTIDELTTLINDPYDYKIILIVAGKYSSEVFLRFHDNHKIDSIFIFSMNKSLYENQTYPKLDSIHTEYVPLFRSVEKRLRSILKHLSIFKIIEQTNKSVRDLEHESAYYAWNQLLRDALMSIESEKSKKDMLDYCRFYYANDPISLKQIDHFEATFNPSEVIRCYTNNYFPFNFINKALRCEDIDALYYLRYFIINLSKQLKELYDQNYLDYQQKYDPYLKVYRGLTLSDEDINRLKTYVNHYISTNGFLSTSLRRDVAEMFAANVIFEIIVDPKQLSNNLVYAYIGTVSLIPDEEEVLFDLGATFKIIDVKHDTDKYIVSMVAANDIDCIKNAYVDKERELIKYPIEVDEHFRSTYTFSMYLMHLGQYDKSISFLNRLLRYTRLYDYERYFILYSLAQAYMKNNQLDNALECALDAYKINKFYGTNGMKRIELILGKVYCLREEYDLALQCYHRSMNEEEEEENDDDDDDDMKLEIHTNISVIYLSNNNLADSFEHLQILLQMLNESNTFDSVSKADAYAVVAKGYHLADDINRAVDYWGKSLLLRTETFPDNHPIFPITYIELANMYEENQEYHLATEYYRKSIESYEKYLSTNDLPTVKVALLLDIGRCHLRMQKFDLSRLNFEEALQIQENIKPCDEMKVVVMYENIALCYWSQKDFDLTIQYYETALGLRKKYSSNSTEIITLYKQIGVCYDEKNQYELARNNYIKALELQQQILPLEELCIADLYSLLGSSYENEKNYEFSIHYYRLGLNIKEKCNTNDSDTVRSYRIISKVYILINEYALAIESLEKALKIHGMANSNEKLTSSDIHSKLAFCYKQNNNYDQSIQHYQYAIDTYVDLPDKSYNILFSLYDQLARLYNQQKHYISALHIYEAMIGISSNMNQNDLLKTVKLYIEMSEVYCKLDQHNLAMDYCTKSMEILKTQYNDQYHLMAKNNELFGIICCHDWKDAMAEDYYRKALELFKMANAHEDVNRLEEILQNGSNRSTEISSIKGVRKRVIVISFLFFFIFIFSFFVRDIICSYVSLSFVFTSLVGMFLLVLFRCAID